MTFHRQLFLAPFLLATIACISAEAGPGLPPAAGADAPAGPNIPTVESLAEASEDGAQLRRIGSFRVKHRVEVAAQSGGTLAEVRFDVGDIVHKGDVVFLLKGRPVKLNLSRSRTALVAAEQRIAATRRDLDRQEELFAAGATTPAAVDQARVAHDAATIQAQDAEVAVSLGKNGVSELHTRAPIDGVVTERHKDPGEAVTSMPPTVVLVIEDHTTLELQFRVPELALQAFEPGASIDLLIPALGQHRSATVTRAGSAVDPRTRTIDIICDIANPDGRLKPGMSVEVTPSSPPAKSTATPA